jgi:hypothetical protein
LLVFQTQFHHLRYVLMFLICLAEMCNHDDGCQPPFQLPSPSPYLMQSQHTIIKLQHYLAVNLKGENVLCIQTVSQHNILCVTVSTIITNAHKRIPSIA